MLCPHHPDWIDSGHSVSPSNRMVTLVVRCRVCKAQKEWTALEDNLVDSFANPKELLDKQSHQLYRELLQDTAEAKGVLKLHYARKAMKTQPSPKDEQEVPEARRDRPGVAVREGGGETPGGEPGDDLQ